MECCLRDDTGQARERMMTPVRELRLLSHPEGRGTAQQAARRLSNIQNIEAENIKKWNEQIISVILPL
jgi:hypothetical protein